MANYDGNWSRRAFLKNFGFAGAMLGLQAEVLFAQPAPEIRRIRATDEPYACLAAQFLAEEFLRLEGFTEIQYVKPGQTVHSKLLASGEIDLVLDLPGTALRRVEAGDPITILAGVHLGCFELFGNERVQSLRDLKGRSVAMSGEDSCEHSFVSAMAAYVGLDPRRDINWVANEPPASMKLFMNGKVDAFLAFPPQPQELRAKKVGHTVVNTTKDKPWSQYFCCMVAMNRNFVRRYPVATKRALRAVLKAADFCSQEPARAARYLVDRGYTSNYEYAFQTLRDVPYDRWRTYSPEDTLRFYALRLRDIGMIKSNPNALIAKAADWRFLRELKKELKA
jgi:NitT/TauT family transport system substrate-binding protein